MSAQMRAEVYREYPLVTGGQDAELDALGVIIECTRDLDADAKKRVVEYLLQRFKLTVI